MHAAAPNVLQPLTAAPTRRLPPLPLPAAQLEPMSESQALDAAYQEVTAQINAVKKSLNAVRA